jgi:hypothetical protein
MTMADMNVCYRTYMSRAGAPVREPVFKVGGQPVLYQLAEWPVCDECGDAMQFLAQIPLKAPIPFSTKWDMAYVFMCGNVSKAPYRCQPYVPGAQNAVLLQKASDALCVADGPTMAPDMIPAFDRVDEPDLDTADYELMEDFEEDIYGWTKLGGTPTWVQDNEAFPCPHCGAGMAMLAQITGDVDYLPYIDFDDWDFRRNIERYEAARAADPYAVLENEHARNLLLSHIPRPTDDERVYLDFDGVGYVFLCSAECCEGAGEFMYQIT